MQTNPKPQVRRKGKHPWDEIRQRFVQGDERLDQEKPVRTWPTTGDLAREYGVQPPALSRAANSPDAQGKTWYDHREAFRMELQRQVDTKTAEKVAKHHVTVNGKIYEVSVRMINGIDRSLQSDDPMPAQYNQLAGAMRKLQQVTGASMDQLRAIMPKEVEAEDDWTLIHRIRTGKKREDPK